MFSAASGCQPVIPGIGAGFRTSFTRWQGRYVLGSTLAELTVSDGTAAGTVPFLPAAVQTNTVTVNGQTPFGTGLAWSSVASVGGVATTADLRISAGIGETPVVIDLGAPSSSSRFLTEVGGLLYFVAGDSSLRVSDGTQSGTLKLTEGLGVTVFPSTDQQLVADGERVRFRGRVIATGEFKVYVSYGTVAGTQLAFGMPPGGFPI